MGLIDLLIIFSILLTFQTVPIFAALDSCTLGKQYHILVIREKGQREIEGMRM